ncbi:sulfatase [Nonomuraea sp. KC401]|uniref:sulfatase family protein n=1 Tax=unclassified Nonomuraea TaxID=2593643 RepID=UPI0010FDA1BB|nr:sulfatase [Nonomuraea sp. KC401]NBE98370.1 sulfatase-like hydrolase/transferase [Nonomuraea sp. K271]TLF73759.1 sulfatase [Nonomuraea sp. KC401]
MLKALSRLVCLLLLLPVGGTAVAEGVPRPNIVFVLADDLETGTLGHFPNITRHLVHQGASFDRYFATNPWCCPSRASTLRSQYVHSHRVWTNTAPEGGFDRFHAQGLERSTIGTWMKQAGYRTALMGKYLNHYPGVTAQETYVPPGWDEWAVPVRKLYQEYGYRLNENGRVADYGWSESDYLTDVLSRKARDFVTASKDPFFLYLAPIPPHNPANPAPRHAGAFPDAMAPRSPSFDQEDVSREPLWVRELPRIGPAGAENIDERFRARLRAMLGVDDLVGSLVKALRESGKLGDTYIFFASDNGFHLGTHRLRRGKTTPFEEAVRVPLVVRGPGVAAGSRIDPLTSAVDLPATFAALGGAPLPPFAEGRSLVPLLGGHPPAQWRRNVLVEFARPANRASARQTPVPGYRALRTDRYTYVRYDTGERQLYDLHADPYQLDNLAASADPALLAGLERRLQAMMACSGATCRQADTVQ